MGAITLCKWQCDRCKEIFDERPQIEGSKFTLQFERDYGFSGYCVKWVEICPDCNDFLAGVIEAISPVSNRDLVHKFCELKTSEVRDIAEHFGFERAPLGAADFSGWVARFFRHLKEARRLGELAVKIAECES